MPLALIVGVAAAAPADAATVYVAQVPQRFDPDFYTNVLTYRALPAETNTVRLLARRESPNHPQTIQVSDSTASLVAGPGCTSLDLQTADCVAKPADFDTSSFDLESDVRLGDGGDLAEVVAGPNAAVAAWRFDLWGEDGDDRLLVPSYRSFYGNLRGGPGDDVIHGLGWAGPQRLNGGPGADEIVGGRGVDILRDGDPPGAPSRDVIDGGSGRRALDELSYGDRTQPLRLDLHAGRGGEPGEDDVLVNVEKVIGGSAGDVVLGSARGETLDGGEGADFINGRQGNDIIAVRSGERAVGGLGNDSFLVTGAARVACGRGYDDIKEVARPARGPLLTGNCELVWRDPRPTDTLTGLFADPRARLTATGLLRVRVRCDCDRGRIAVTDPRPPFATLAAERFPLQFPPGPEAEYGEAYARGAAFVRLPRRISARIRRGGVQLRFAVRAGAKRMVWSVRVSSAG